MIKCSCIPKYVNRDFKNYPRLKYDNQVIIRIIIKINLNKFVWIKPFHYNSIKQKYQSKSIILWDKAAT
ncbi:hypothetical protein SAMN05444484_109118 [Flavobacterium chilense]|uniref:Uncharacterized protein n=1 Tax=Flavobacterium chilense TaxID=946677 RepID=A0A1M7LHQ3_9FLAO|nr:hypothetical protein SAMN05444484_109118 [Flavobacterium chilense]